METFLSLFTQPLVIAISAAALSIAINSVALMVRRLSDRLDRIIELLEEK